MSKNQLPIPFKLVHIEEIQFSVFQENLDSNRVIEENVGFGFGTHLADRTIITTFQYVLKIEDKPLLKIEVACYFEVERRSFDKFYENKKKVLPVGFARHLAMITIGTTRGILFANTKNTSLNPYFIGLLNIEEIITKDVEIEIHEVS